MVGTTQSILRLYNNQKGGRMNNLAFAHIIFPLLLSFTYSYFIILLNKIYFLTFLLLGVFVVLVCFYGLAMYGVLNRKPGYESEQSTENRLGVEKMCEYKQNEERKNELILMMRENITYQRLHTLENEYLGLYKEPSFCEVCEMMRAARSHHCFQCQRCILRKEKHSELIGMCVGERNMKIFMQYLFIAMVLCVFMVSSLMAITLLQHHQLNDFSPLELVMFAFLEMTLGAASALFAKEFFISYFNAIDNITETERKQGIINSKNNPFRHENYYHGLFKRTLDYLKLADVADPTNWLELQDEH